MNNKFTTYGLLGLMVIALITLAVLQYNWLGSVSEAEKKRLEENLEASSTNFVVDLNRNFSQLSEIFKIQISGNDSEIEDLIGDSYLNWVSNSIYPELVDSIFYVQNISTDETSVEIFKSDPSRLMETEIPDYISEWVNEQKKIKVNPETRIAIMRSPDLGRPTLIPIPVQIIDLVRFDNLQSGSNLKVNLNIDQADHVVLLKLDDELIKKEVISSVAENFFSESYQDQYHLSILRENEGEKLIYYTTAGFEIPEPDIKKRLNTVEISSVFFVGSSRIDRQSNTGFSIFTNLDTLGQDIEGVEIKKRSTEHFTEVFEGLTSSGARNLNNTNQRVVVRSDTTITGNYSATSTFTADLSTPGWEFWLSFKEGSLDQFVNKTKNRNLAISFGILLILGLSIGTIVLFSQRTRELAEKQMLFVAGVSHELRTPLTVIRSAAENLKEGVVQDEKRKKEYAQLMLKEGRRLSDMVDQIMEFSGIQSGKKVYQFSEFEIQPFLENLIEENRIHLEEKGMSLEYFMNLENKTLTADKDALFLALSNLIQNAIKFSDTEPTISLKVSDSELGSKKAIKFEVKDNGLGIPEEEQHYVFEPFYRGKYSVDQQVKGNGIGLSLVQKVVQAHNGDITLKSKIKEGASFQIVIPLQNGEPNG